ncbi:cysteine synthase A [Mesobacillus boroniphilus]|uniref:cysteine synthase n=1 Tax=Mesobacillus boroniphilus TaxID=308892 RepID=A0A944CNT8_9BACI|nr:cysteine synthase A [Mesobacillus boroniphilus]MBS8266385.1 cysteine synthase A [Mesobacillus boroniphilus]
MNYAETIADLIGKTPLLKLQKLSDQANCFAKCEFLNPISIKDRPVLKIIEDAEEKGQIKPGDTLIEMTSGNTGMALAYIASVKGYRAILVMSEIQSVERRKIMKAFGADLILTPAEEGTAGAKKKLQEILKEHQDYYYVGQHKNMNNPESHYKTTGPELWEDTDGKIDILVAGLGTGGTICGAGKYLKEKNPDMKLVAVEPYDAPFISKGVFKAHRIMGTAPGFMPETLNKEIIDEIMLVKEEEAFDMCRQLANKEGVLVGISSGAVASIMQELCNRPENKGKNIVGIFADSGQRYLSVEGLFNS